MANEFARNIQDASLNPATFTLPASAGSTQSAAIDLGADTLKPESFEVELSVPALSTTINPGTNSAGFIYIIESSTTSTFAAVARTLASITYAGSTTTATAAALLRTRVPSNCERYIRAKITGGATMADASALVGTVTLRF